ncbi:hypothetical protein MATL_G00190760, partial [Megalops atlanticus]
YPLERPRSRSPIGRSQSPRSHSPSYTSCSSTHSPQGACRGEWSNGLGATGAAWDCSPHGRWEEEGDEAYWRNGDEDTPDGWVQDRWKPRLAPTDRWSSALPEERAEGPRRSRERYPRRSPLGLSPPYRSKEEDFYKKSDRSPRQPYQQQEGKSSRRDTEGRHRSRHSESEALDDSAAARTPEDRKQTSPDRGRSRKSSQRHTTNREEEKEPKNQDGSQERPTKDKPASPQRKGKDTEVRQCERPTDSETEGGGSGNETEEESWYPQSMEELVTVDEVGEEEEDSVPEPDLPEEEAEEAPGTADSGDPEKEVAQNDGGEGRMNAEPPPQERTGETLDTQLKRQTPDSAASEQQGSDQRHAPGQDLNAALEEPHSCTDTPFTPQASRLNHEDSKPSGGSSSLATANLVLSTSVSTDVQHKAEQTGGIPRTDILNTSHGLSPSNTDSEDKTATSSLWEQDKSFTEHSIPLGVEFVVPRSGFFCKLCGLFYASEHTAKTAHCRSTVHYKNLQKYLSQLARQSTENTSTDQGDHQGPDPIQEK